MPIPTTATFYAKARALGYSFAVTDNGMFGFGTEYFGDREKAEAFADRKNSGWVSRPFVVVAL